MSSSTYPTLLSHILEGKLYRPLIDAPEVARHRADWRHLFAELAVNPPRDQEISRRFHTKWHESHHFIRELLDDDDLLVEAAKVWLPPYVGPSLVLFRGENVDRYQRGAIGTAWSDQEETALMFARGLNAVGCGGVLLRVSASVEAIIAGPSDHSANWLREREFTVDVRKTAGVEALARFAPSH